MAGRTEVEAYGRQNWQANSYILKWQAMSINGRQKSYQVKMAGNEYRWQAELKSRHMAGKIGRQTHIY